jgi:type I restriction enzyme S subunit
VKHPSYVRYRPSGVTWLGSVPEHWHVKRLRTAASYWVSNVDKIPDEDEKSVRLCNYTDVYNHEHIRADMDFMEATATSDEIRRFGLRVGDVLITKDSEEWSDIAVPALVVTTASDFVCGYHLAIVRPEPPKLFGPFLLRAFQSSAVNQQFQVAANGVTRYGLSKSAIGQAWLPLPPLPEQRAIADFLDAQTATLASLVAKRQALVERLREKRASLISQVVTRGLPPEAARAVGLNPYPKMKPSGTGWLGDVPEHWGVKPLRYIFQNLDHRRVPLAGEDRAAMSKTYPYYGASGVIDHVEDYLFDDTLLLVAEDGANLLSRSSPLAFLASGQFWVNNHAHVLKPLSGDIRYWVSLLQTFDYNPLVTGAAQPKLTGERLGGIRLPAPPSREQIAIAQYLDRETERIDEMVAKAEASIERLHEYRAALITAAVTGEIDVRGVA